ncbi:hypothetical protein EYF80_002641 [Liparis tanakae]|uniref:Uncharacterized protein n=1 Tax=Liparis tanakae TaxID=230148 RepID=A0A4Z2J9I9_9TELE|nr:hypothetical protein EYF80_002641 [Liparis tanakae]
MHGFCRTPMILWIRSMATLSWKLLSPGKEESCTMSHMNCVDSRVESVEQMDCGKCVYGGDRLPASVARNPMVLAQVSVQPGGNPRLEASLTSLQLPLPSFTSLLRWQLLSDRSRCGEGLGDDGASAWLCFLEQSDSCSLSLSLASQSMELSESVADILGCRI